MDRPGAPPCPPCAACCIGLEVELVGGIDDVPDELVDVAPEDYLVMARRADGSCLALVEGACSIYDQRPAECRAFRRGSRDCRAARRRVGFVSVQGRAARA